jgi:hypothetical protein
MVNKTKQLGKWFEQKVQDELQMLKGTRYCTFVRLYDTGSAQGAYLPEQPGDFIVVPRYFSGAILLECKSSGVKDSLRGCLSANVKKEQAAQHLIWESVGQPAWFLFYSKEDDMLELWPGGYVATCRNAGRPLNYEHMTDRTRFGNLKRLLTDMVTPPGDSL